jgi:prepilin-type N-terminal cleavage/methylation domain-containing protein
MLRISTRTVTTSRRSETLIRPFDSLRRSGRLSEESGVIVRHRNRGGENSGRMPIPYTSQGAANDPSTEIECRSGAPHTTPVRAFSLVELIIVIVILGVIAAIAIPRVSSGASRSQESALVSTLAVMRRAFDTYAAEHNGVFPGKNADGQGGAAQTGTAFLNQLTLYSDANGSTSQTLTAQHQFGPYLRSIPGVPVGPYQGSKTVAIDTSNSPPLATGASEGWVYNPLTGEIIANSDEANAEGTRAYDEY